MSQAGIAIIYTPRRFYIFMRRTTPVEPFEPAEPLSHAIKGGTPHGLPLKFESRDD